MKYIKLVKQLVWRSQTQSRKQMGRRLASRLGFDSRHAVMVMHLITVFYIIHQMTYNTIWRESVTLNSTEATSADQEETKYVHTCKKIKYLQNHLHVIN